MTIQNLLSTIQCVDLNLFKLVDYLKSSQIAIRLDDNQDEIGPVKQVENLLNALNNRNQDARISIHVETLSKNSLIQFILLNPAQHFQGIIKQARSGIYFY